MKSRVVSRRRLIFGGTLVLIIAAGAVSGFFAQQQAFDAETEYVAEELRDEPCLSNWGVNEGTASKRVSITGVTAGGFQVAVSMPYAYTVEDENGEPVFADTSTDAVYEVTFMNTRRIRGDTVRIC